MKTTSPHPEELSELLIALTDGDIEPRQFNRLQTLLLGDEDAQLYFRRYMRLCALLEFERAAALDKGAEVRGQRSEVEIRDSGFGLSRAGRFSSQQLDISGQRLEKREGRGESGQEVESGEWRVESEAQRPKTQDLRPEFPIINLQIPTLHSPLSTLTSWAFSYSVATLFLAVALFGAWFTTITHPDDDALAKNNQPIAMPSGSATKDPSQFIFVGHVSGMVDCQWADPTTSTVSGAGVTLGRRYALKSGLMELTYNSGAKVILQGPCDFKVESARSGFLYVGKLVARINEKGEGGREKGERVARGERRVESGKQIPKIQDLRPKTEISKSQIPNPKSPSPLSPLPSPHFSVRTPTALVEDLGTEFGVVVNAAGETASHVFEGKVLVRVEGAVDGGRGTGDDNLKSEIRNQKSEIILSAGQSAQVEREEKTGRLKLVAGEKPASMGQEKFTRRLREPPKLLDLLDIIAGGNGVGARRQAGIDPTTGNRESEYQADYRGSFGLYRQVAWHRLIDGVFVPDGRRGTVQLDSTGWMYDDFPATTGGTWGAIWARPPEIEPQERHKGWIFDLGDAEKFTPDRRGLLGFHANAGMTFDLEAVRKLFSGSRPTGFRAVAGLSNARLRRSEPESAHGMVEVWVFVDGRLMLHRKDVRLETGAIVLDVSLEPEDRFLTLAVTDGGNGMNADWFVFGDPVLRMTSTESNNLSKTAKENRNKTKPL